MCAVNMGKQTRENGKRRRRRKGTRGTEAKLRFASVLSSVSLTCEPVKDKNPSLKDIC